MTGEKQFTRKDAARQNLENFMAFHNAVTTQKIQCGELKHSEANYLSLDNAGREYVGAISALVAFANPASVNHNKSVAAVKHGANGDSGLMARLEQIGRTFGQQIISAASSIQKAGLGEGAAVREALHSLAGNSVYDNFVNVGVLARQQHQKATLADLMTSSGDSYALPLENGTTGTNVSRFRFPIERVSGSPKIINGDIAAQGHPKFDVNQTQVSFLNQFKDAVTLAQPFTITQGRKDQYAGYEKAASPTLAGIILQNLYYEAQQTAIMRMVELLLFDGFGPNASYRDDGGDYGLLSTGIQLTLADAGAITPALATAAQWAAAPTKLVQTISNYYYKQTVAAPFSAGADPSLVYKDVLRLFNLYEQQFIDFEAEKLVLLVPTTTYGAQAQYPSGGTFNKNLRELIQTANSSLLRNIEIHESPLMNYRATNQFGEAGNGCNVFALLVVGAPPEKKPIIMPGQTVLPQVVASNVNALSMEYYAQYVTGGLAWRNYGGAFLLKYDVAP